MDRKKVGVKGNVKVLLTDKYELKEEEKYLDLGNGKKLRMPIPHIDTFGNTNVIEEHNQVLISGLFEYCLLYTSPSPRDGLLSRMPSSA